MKKVVRIIAIVLVICFVFIVFKALFRSAKIKNDIGNCTKFSCVSQLSRSIEIDKDGDTYSTVKKGQDHFLSNYPLTMYDAAGTEIAHSGNECHFVSKDSHVINVNNNYTAEMVNTGSFLNNSFDIYNPEGEKIAQMKSGVLYNTDRKVIAEYNPKFSNDNFDVCISDNCKLDEDTVLLIFCSYYKDKNKDDHSTDNSFYYFFFMGH